MLLDKDVKEGVPVFSGVDDGNSTIEGGFNKEMTKMEGVGTSEEPAREDLQSEANGVLRPRFPLFVDWHLGVPCMGDFIRR